MALRPRLSAGLPLSNEQMIRFQKISLAYDRQAPKSLDDFIFGNLAIMIPLCGILDPWLCVPAFQQVCYFRMSITL